MKRSTHPEAYDYMIKIGIPRKEVDDCLDAYGIGLWEAHADLRAAGKLPASAMLRESTEDNESSDDDIDDIMNSPINPD